MTLKDSGHQSDYTLNLQWTGKEWQTHCSAPPKRLVVGYSLTVPLPDAAIQPAPPSGDRRLLFPKDTWLYLPITPVRDQKTLDTVVGKHFYDQGLSSHPSEDKTFVPIRLLEDLYIQKTQRGRTWRCAQCECQVADDNHTFGSLNEAGQHALRKWTERSGAINVFSEVLFKHESSYLCTNYKRIFVVDGIPPPPKKTDPVDEPLKLPGM
jgi:hypothetical protein